MYNLKYFTENNKKRLFENILNSIAEPVPVQFIKVINNI